MLSGRWVAASGIACVDDEARARTKATLIILIIWRSSIITFFWKVLPKPIVWQLALRATMSASKALVLASKSAECRLAAFLIDLSMRMENSKALDLPMSHHDIADHLGLTIETISRTTTNVDPNRADQMSALVQKRPNCCMSAFCQNGL
jgi:hypothetical protein